MKNKRRLCIVLTILILLLPNAQAIAAGFAIIEQSASGMGNAFAGGAASAEDASTIFFNPAGMSRLGQQFIFASHIIVPQAKFNDESSSTAIFGSDLTGGSDNAGQSALVPNLYAVYPFNDELTLGLGIYAPFGLATKYHDDWVGRYHAVESDLRTININPSIAYSINKQWSAGLGINFQVLDITLSNAIDFGSLCVGAFGNGDPIPCTAVGVEAQQNDGFVKFEGENDGIGIGWNAGVIYEISDATRIGMAYRSEIKQDLKGTADFTVPGSVLFLTLDAQQIPIRFTDTGITSEITLPETLSLSLFHQHEKFSIMADITWTHWNVFEELLIDYSNPLQPDSVTTENWENSFRFAVGLDHQVNPSWKFKTGIAMDQTPIANAELRTARLPGNNRTWLSIGSSFTINDNFIIDLGYSHLIISDANINNNFESGIPTINHTLNGKYESSVDIFSAHLRWNY